jgi:septum formation inhibitor MinC
MRDASDELLDAIRDAVDPAEREFRIKVDRQQRLYTTFATSYNASDLASRSAAVSAAREFLQDYGNDQNVAEIATFMRRNLPRLEQGVRMMEQRELAMERARAQAVERQQRNEQQRLDRERRREEAAARAANGQNNNSGAASNQRLPAASKTEAPRQPSDPVTRPPRIPIGRRP